MSIEDLRRKVDETDTRIVKLIAERLRIAEEIGREKRKQGEQVTDRERERNDQSLHSLSYNRTDHSQTLCTLLVFR